MNQKRNKYMNKQEKKNEKKEWRKNDGMKKETIKRINKKKQ